MENSSGVVIRDLGSNRRHRLGGHFEGPLWDGSRADRPILVALFRGNPLWKLPSPLLGPNTMPVSDRSPAAPNGLLLSSSCPQ